MLAGFGAEAINPWLAFDTIEDLCLHGTVGLAPAEARANYSTAVGKGILKVMSKMGISTFQSYCGAQIFDGVGLGQALVDKCFGGHGCDNRGPRPVRARRRDCSAAPPGLEYPG